MIILFAILLFSILIFVHEFGHFIAAKLSGVQVNEFSIFMGPAIFKKRKGDTLYAIRCIPIGGYCAMEGEDEESENPRAFGAAKWWKRLIILVAGAAMNFLIGVLLLAIIIAPAQRFITPDVVELESGSALAEGNGIQAGDRILEVADEKIYVQSDFSMILSVKGDGRHDVLVERGGEKVLLEDVLFERREFTDEAGETAMLYGITFGTTEATFLRKVSYTWNSAVDYVRTVRLSLQMLFTGNAGLKDMSGPVGIVQQMSSTASQTTSPGDAVMTLLNFGALIAINLAVMNLLPIPALDGGRVVGLLITTAVEAITKKKINPKYESYLHAGGMILLLVLMAVITFKDIFFIFKG